jgi:putative membrane protein
MEPQRDSMRVLLTWGAMLVGVGIVLLLGVSLAAWSLGGTAPAGSTVSGAVFNPFWQVITFLAWLLVIGGIVLLSLWLVRKLWPAISASGGYPRNGWMPDEAIRIVQLRYARGEISREEYERIRTDLFREQPPAEPEPVERPRMAA